MGHQAWATAQRHPSALLTAPWPHFHQPSWFLPSPSTHLLCPDCRASALQACSPSPSARIPSRRSRQAPAIPSPSFRQGLSWGPAGLLGTQPTLSCHLHWIHLPQSPTGSSVSQLLGPYGFSSQPLRTFNFSTGGGDWDLTTRQTTVRTVRKRLHPANTSGGECGLTPLLPSHCSCIRLCATPQTAAHRAPPSLGFSRQEHWSGLPFPSPMCESENSSVVSDSPRPHGPQPTRLPCPWGFLGKSTGVGCHCLLCLTPLAPCNQTARKTAFCLFRRWHPGPPVLTSHNPPGMPGVYTSPVLQQRSQGSDS